MQSCQDACVMKWIFCKCKVNVHGWNDCVCLNVHVIKLKDGMHVKCNVYYVGKKGKSRHKVRGSECG